MKLTESTFTEANRLSETRFTWEKFCSKNRILSQQIFSPNGTLLPRWELVGWMSSKGLTIRPRAIGQAILVRCIEDDGDFYEGLEVWCHFDSAAFCDPIVLKQGA